MLQTEVPTPYLVIAHVKWTMYVLGLMGEDTSGVSCAGLPSGTDAARAEAWSVVVGTDLPIGTVLGFVENPARDFFCVDALHQESIAVIQVRQAARVCQVIKGYYSLRCSIQQFSIIDRSGCSAIEGTEVLPAQGQVLQTITAKDMLAGELAERAIWREQVNCAY